MRLPIVAPEREGIWPTYNRSLRRELRENGHAFIMDELRGIAETVRKAANPVYDHTILRVEQCMGGNWRGCGIGAGYSVLGTHNYRHIGPLDFSGYEHIYFIGHEPAKFKETCLRNRDHVEQVIFDLTPHEVRQVVTGIARFSHYDIRQKL